MKKFNFSDIIFLKKATSEFDKETFLMACEMEDSNHFKNIFNEEKFEILLIRNTNSIKTLIVINRGDIQKYEVVPNELVATNSFYKISSKTREKLNKLIESVEDEISEIKLRKIVSCVNAELESVTTRQNKHEEIQR